jgi:hypothetical protein
LLPSATTFTSSPYHRAPPDASDAPSFHSTRSAVPLSEDDDREDDYDKEDVCHAVEREGAYDPTRPTLGISDVRDDGWSDDSDVPSSSESESSDDGNDEGDLKMDVL